MSKKSCIKVCKKCGKEFVAQSGYVRYCNDCAEEVKKENLHKNQLKQRKKNTTTLKEIQLSANISVHDLNIKANKAKDFIENGDKVKVVLNLKGRELSRREESKRTFYQFISIMLDSGLVSFDSAPRDEERKSIVIFKKK